MPNYYNMQQALANQEAETQVGQMESGAGGGGDPLSQMESGAGDGGDDRDGIDRLITAIESQGLGQDSSGQIGDDFLATPAADAADRTPFALIGGIRRAAPARRGGIAYSLMFDVCGHYL